MKHALRDASRAAVPNHWDGIAFLLILALLAFVAQGAHDMHASLAMMEATPLTLSPVALPEYALRTVLRMFAAMAVSLVFTFIFATWAAKSRRAEYVLIPALDILQSVPVLGFISFTVIFFLNLFPGRVLGAECAAVFAIFTSQAWNMAFSFYYSLKSIPADLQEVSRSFRFSAWQRFWQLEVPFALPGLIWNAMMSMSAGWFFVVASEAITVGKQSFMLPGIGSYVALAIAERDVPAILWAVVTMGLVIIAYDQLLFRPLVAWAEKFRFNQESAPEGADSWVLTLWSRTRLLRVLLAPLRRALERFMQIRIPSFMPRLRFPTPFKRKHGDMIWALVLSIGLLYISWRLFAYLSGYLMLADVQQTVLMGLATLTRIVVLIILVSLIWVPVGVWVGLRPKLAAKIQPIAQILAAFPANLLFPLVVMGIVQFELNPNIWLSPLLVLGTQWYILFNVIAGTMQIPSDFREVAKSFRLRGWQWWRMVMLPAIFPHYVTGALNAAGGAWNASIVAEIVTWGNTTLQAYGLGAYIAQATFTGDYPRIVLGIAVMVVLVLLLNRLLWRRLYHYALTRFS